MAVYPLKLIINYRIFIHFVLRSIGSVSAPLLPLPCCSAWHNPHQQRWCNRTRCGLATAL